MAQSWLHVINKKFLHPASTTENSNLIDFGWISGKLSDNTNDCCSKDHGIVYIYTNTQSHLHINHHLFHSSFQPIFATSRQPLMLTDSQLILLFPKDPSLHRSFWTMGVRTLKGRRFTKRATVS